MHLPLSSVVSPLANTSVNCKRKQKKNHSRFRVMWNCNVILVSRWLTLYKNTWELIDICQSGCSTFGSTPGGVSFSITILEISSVCTAPGHRLTDATPLLFSSTAVSAASLSHCHTKAAQHIDGWSQELKWRPLNSHSPNCCNKKIFEKCGVYDKLFVYKYTAKHICIYRCRSKGKTWQVVNYNRFYPHLLPFPSHIRIMEMGEYTVHTYIHTFYKPDSGLSLPAQFSQNECALGFSRLRLYRHTTKYKRTLIANIDALIKMNRQVDSQQPCQPHRPHWRGTAVHPWKRSWRLGPFPGPPSVWKHRLSKSNGLCRV